jgi:hypothetical protein
MAKKKESNGEFMADLHGYQGSEVAQQQDGADCHCHLSRLRRIKRILPVLSVYGIVKRVGECATFPNQSRR